MRLLLDTHIWLWSLLEPSRLGLRVQHELVNQQNELWLSPISTWEALFLNAKGRFRLPADVHGWMAQATEKLREAPLTHEIAIASQATTTAASGPCRPLPGSDRSNPRFDPGNCRHTVTGAGENQNVGQSLTASRT